METIRVNMTPCEDIKTIHASQNDNEAREWGFELHNNGEKIDSSSISNQMVFKAYEGGTEQILPENGAVPVTAPFVGDIQYSDATRTDQEFLYRQSPTEKDGNAKIKNLYGNTLVWNQLVQNGNFADNSKWSLPSTATAVISNNELSSTYASAYPSVSQALSIKAGHKFYLSFEYKASVNNNTPNGFFFSDTQDRSVLVTALNYTTTYKKYEGILSYSNNDLARIRLAYFEPNRWTAGDVISIKNVQLFDLTQMGLDISSPSEFTSLFPLPYYDYCKGAMLSFGGRNVKFNQLLQNGNITSASGWTPTRGTVSASGNVLSYTYTEVAIGAVENRVQTNVGTVSGHSYLLSVDAKLSKAKTVLVLFTSNGTYNVNGTYSANTWKNVHTIVKESSNSTYVGIGFNADSNNVNGDVEQIRNFQVFDLTEMFGAGNEPSAEGFLELFPNDYYEYNVGKHMNLGQPVSLKTVGKNLLPTDLRMTSLYGLNDDKSIYQFNTSSAPFTWSYENSAFRVTLPSGQYKVGFIAKTKSTSISSGLILTDSDNNFIVTRGGSLNNLERGEYSFSLTKTTDLGLCVKVYDGVWWLYIIDAENEMATYEPYTSSTLSLPISTYFPTGMKSAGSVYDELTPSNAITRIGAVDLGTLNWSYVSNDRRFIAIISDAKSSSGLTVLENIVSAKYENATWENILTQAKDKIIALHYTSNNSYVAVIDNDYSNASTFKSAMSGVMLYYELATPTETSFTTASLVTENAEIPLSNNDGTLIGKCTEQLSENPGFIDAKIKLSDSDGECYSNKLQLHVERSPQ